MPCDLHLQRVRKLRKDVAAFPGAEIGHFAISPCGAVAVAAAAQLMNLVGKILGQVLRLDEAHDRLHVLARAHKLFVLFHHGVRDLAENVCVQCDIHEHDHACEADFPPVGRRHITNKPICRDTRRDPIVRNEVAGEDVALLEHGRETKAVVRVKPRFVPFTAI